jgi:hypothetical protein
MGAASLNPQFSPDTETYTASTTNSSNQITATPESADATVIIELNGKPLNNGAAAVWADGENEVAITVSVGDANRVYIFTVTKS